MGHLSSRLRRAPSFVIAPALAVGLLGIPTVDTAPEPTPVEAELDTIELDGVDSAAAATESMPDTPEDHDHGDESSAAPTPGVDDAEHGEEHAFEVAATSEQTDTDPFRVVAVTWDDSDVQVDELNAWIRYRSDDGWSQWYPLPSSDGHAPDPGSSEEAGMRQGTEPLVVPESDGVQVRVDTADGEDVEDLRVDLIDPGDSPADQTAGTAPAGQAQAAAQPRIYTRAEWGADESLRGSGVQYGQIQAGFVHHTVNSNSYTASEVPAIIRGIYAFHVKSRGYRDVGYNFLIDKWGRIWEGRYGGIDKPVTGAHTYGHNDDAFAASTIGTFTDTEPTQATLDAYAKLFAWKFDMNGVDATGRANLDGTVVNTVSGHRDTYATLCPGGRLYAKLPQIRTATAALQSSGASGTASAAPSMTTTLSSSRIASGETTTLAVRTQNVRPGTTVVLKRRVEGQPWKRVRLTTLDASGDLTFGLAPKKPRAYDFRVIVRSDPRLRSAVKRVTVVVPTPSLSVRLSDSQITSGASARLDVTTAYVPAGTSVVLKRRVEGQSWKRVRLTTLGSSGTLTFGLAPKKPRSYDFRVIVRGDPRLRSAIKRVTVVKAASSPAASPAPTTSSFVARGSDVFTRPSDGVFRMVGHGWGHGRGLSQWGANAAAAQGVREPQITSTYYPGTTRSGTSSNQLVKVLLTADTGTDVIVRAESGLRVTFTGSDGATVRATLPGSPGGCSAPWWRARATGSDLAIDSLCGQSWKVWRSAAKVNGDRPVVFSPSDGMVDVPRRTSSGFVRKAYRGSIEAHRSGSSVRAVNAVRMEDYLRAVVPNEMPSSWPQEALRAQAVAARTYAMREAEDRGGYFDVYDTTASQVYAGARLYDGSWRVTRSYEAASTDAAISATRGVHLRYAGRPAFTQFSSSNGGVSAAGTQPYLARRADGWDRAATANSRLNWTDSVSAASLERTFPSIGRLERIRVTSREGLGDWGGRILTMVVQGSRGSVTVSGDSRVRSALGTNSSYLTFR